MLKSVDEGLLDQVFGLLRIEQHRGDGFPDLLLVSADHGFVSVNLATQHSRHNPLNLGCAHGPSLTTMPPKAKSNTKVLEIVKSVVGDPSAVRGSGLLSASALSERVSKWCAVNGAMKQGRTCLRTPSMGGGLRP